MTRVAHALAAMALLAGLQPMLASPAAAIDILPRDYYLLPPGTNVTALYYNFVHGSELNLAGGPTFSDKTHVTANVGILRQVYYGALDGRAWAAQLIVPYGAESGQIAGLNLPGTRGVGDIMLSAGMSFLPHPEPTWNVAMTLYVAMPTGDYVSSRTLNLGSNRWSFNPQIGYTQAIGDSFWLDVAVDLIAYTANRDVGLPGATLHQAPSFQGQVWFSYVPDPASLISIGYNALAGGARHINDVDTGIRTQSQQVRAAYTRTFTSWFQMVGSVGHDVAVSGGFKKEVDVMLRAALIY
ncbi:MAG: transporter [Acetobacteraceae bacterium]|nr:transporter [Pseudomonadota bacterium]